MRQIELFHTKYLMSNNTKYHNYIILILNKNKNNINLKVKKLSD